MKSSSGKAKENRVVAEAEIGRAVHKLSGQVARQIAAREVIERPATRAELQWR